MIDREPRFEPTLESRLSGNSSRVHTALQNSNLFKTYALSAAEFGIPVAWLCSARGYGCRIERNTNELEYRERVPKVVLRRARNFASRESSHDITIKTYVETKNGRKAKRKHDGHAVYYCSRSTTGAVETTP